MTLEQGKEDNHIVYICILPIRYNGEYIDLDLVRKCYKEDVEAILYDGTNPLSPISNPEYVATIRNAMMSFKECIDSINPVDDNILDHHYIMIYKKIDTFIGPDAKLEESGLYPYIIHNKIERYSFRV